jgi:hypothetical protein
MFCIQYKKASFEDRQDFVDDKFEVEVADVGVGQVEEEEDDDDLDPNQLGRITILLALSK